MEPEEFLILECPACERSVKIKADAAGSRVGCPYCKEPIEIAGAEDDDDEIAEEFVEDRPLEFRRIEAASLKPTPDKVDEEATVESVGTGRGERRKHRKRHSSELLGWEDESPRKSESDEGGDAQDDGDSSEFLEMDPDSPGGVRLKRVRRKKLLTKKDKFIRIVTASVFVAAVAIAGLILYSAIVQGTKEIVDVFNPTISDELQALIDKAKEKPISPDLTMSDEQLATATLTGFLEAKTVKERALYVRNPAETIPMMEHWYGTNPDEANKAWPKPEILNRKKMRLPDGRYFIVLAVEFGAEGQKVMALEQSGSADNIKLDWPTAVEYQPMDLESFKASKTREPVTFWVKVKRADFYSFSFSDQEKYQAVELTYPGRTNFKLIGYIDRKQTWAPALLAMLDAGKSPSLIVELNYPLGEIKDPALVEISSVVADNWWPAEYTAPK